MRLALLALALLLAAPLASNPTRAAGGPYCEEFGQCWVSHLLYATADGRYGNATLVATREGTVCESRFAGFACTYPASVSGVLITPSPKGASALYFRGAGTVTAEGAAVNPNGPPGFAPRSVGAFAAHLTGDLPLDATFAWGSTIEANAGTGTLGGVDAAFVGTP